MGKKNWVKTEWRRCQNSLNIFQIGVLRTLLLELLSLTSVKKKRWPLELRVLSAFLNSQFHVYHLWELKIKVLIVLLFRQIVFRKKKKVLGVGNIYSNVSFNLLQNLTNLPSWAFLALSWTNMQVSSVCFLRRDNAGHGKVTKAAAVCELLCSILKTSKVRMKKMLYIAVLFLL